MSVSIGNDLIPAVRRAVQPTVYWGRRGTTTFEALDVRHAIAEMNDGHRAVVRSQDDDLHGSAAEGIAMGQEVDVLAWPQPSRRTPPSAAGEVPRGNRHQEG